MGRCRTPCQQNWEKLFCGYWNRDLQVWQQPQQLNRAGHFGYALWKGMKKFGGLLRYGIPDFKMEKSILDRRVKVLVEEGNYN